MTGKVTAAPIRLGVLGAARIADLAIVRPARVTGHRLVAVAARDRRRAEDFAQRHGVERALGTYADVLADSDVEAIYNPLANAQHAAHRRLLSRRRPSPAASRPAAHQRSSPLTRADWLPRQSVTRRCPRPRTPGAS
jgi:GFO/IDH/MocA oxidoreductase family protein